MMDELRGQYDQQAERLVAAESERRQCVEEFDAVQGVYRTAMARVQALEVCGLAHTHTNTRLPAS